MSGVTAHSKKEVYSPTNRMKATHRLCPAQVVHAQTKMKGGPILTDDLAGDHVLGHSLGKWK